MDKNFFGHSTVMDFSSLVEYSPGGIISKQVMTKESGNITLFSFDQDQKLSEHTAPYDAMVQVIEGQAEIIINRQPYLLKSGHSIIMPANVPHALFAVKPFKMLLTMIKESKNG